MDLSFLSARNLPSPEEIQEEVKRDSKLLVPLGESKSEIPAETASRLDESGIDPESVAKEDCTVSLIDNTPASGDFENCPGRLKCRECDRVVPLKKTTKKPLLILCRNCGATINRVMVFKAGIDLDGKTAVQACTKEEWLEIVGEKPKEWFDLYKVAEVWDGLYVVYIPTDLLELNAMVEKEEMKRTSFFDRGRALKDQVETKEDLSKLALSVRMATEIINSYMAFTTGTITAMREKKVEFGLQIMEDIPTVKPTQVKTTRKKKAAPQVDKKTTDDMIKSMGVSNLEELMKEMQEANVFTPKKG